MNIDMTYSPNRAWILRCLAGQHLLVPTGPQAREQGGFFKLNPTAARIFEMAGAGCPGPEICARLAEAFDADPDRVAADVDEILATFCQLGALHPRKAPAS